MRYRLVRTWFAMCLLCAATLAEGQSPAPQPAGQPVTLRYAMKEGETARYKRVSTTSPVDPGSAAGPQRSEVVFDEVILKVQPDGGFSRQFTFGGGTARSTGTHDSRGRLTALLINGKEASPADRLFALVGLPVLPDHPVKPGDTWSYEVDNPAAKGAKVRLEYTYVGAEPVGGVATNLVRIRASVESPVKVSSETLFNLDADGRTIRVRGTLTGLPGFDGPTKEVTEVTRVPAASAASTSR